MNLNVIGRLVRSYHNSFSHPRWVGHIARRQLHGYENSPSTEYTLPNCCVRGRNYPYICCSASVLTNCSVLKITRPSYLSGGYLNFYNGLREFHNDRICRHTSGDCPKNCRDSPEDKKKKTLFQNFKQMYRDYWYVLVPVHVVTSVAWFGGFYYLVKSGVDIVAILEKFGLSERWSEQLRDSKAGYLAMTFALYKLASPLRYMVTIGGSTFAIKWLRDFGLIKPLRTNDIKNMYNDKKKSLKEKRRKKKEMKEKR